MNNKRLVNVIMIHRGYSKYLERNIEITSKNNKIFLIGDKSLQHLEKKYNNLEFYDLNNYLNTKEIINYEKSFINYSTNSYEFEWFCFIRLFIIKKFLSENKLKNVFHLDSDNILLRNINEINFESEIAYSVPLYQNEYRMSANICHGLINYEYCAAFEDIYVGIYVDRSKFYLIEKKILYHKQNNISGGICDMTLHYLIYQSGKLKIQNLVFPVLDLNEDLNYFVEDINSPEGPQAKVNFEQKKGLNKIHNGMYIYNIYDKEYYKIVNIHFQGKSKKHLNIFTKYKLKY